MSTDKDRASQTVITPEAIAGFPKLFKAEPDLNGEEKFSVTLIFPKGTDLTAVKKAVAAAAKKKFGDQAGETIRNQEHPFIRGASTKDKAKIKKYGWPEGCSYIVAKSKDRPGIVSTYRDAEGKPQIITDENQIYSGVIVKAQLFAHPYDSAGNKGVTLFLNNIQKVKDGERTGGRVAAQDVFEATDEPVDLGELEAAAVGAGDDSDDPMAGLL